MDITRWSIQRQNNIKTSFVVTALGSLSQDKGFLAQGIVDNSIK